MPGPRPRRHVEQAAGAGMDAQGRRERPRPIVHHTRRSHVQRRALRSRGRARGGGLRGRHVGCGYGGARSPPGCHDRHVTLAAERVCIGAAGSTRRARGIAQASAGGGSALPQRGVRGCGPAEGVQSVPAVQDVPAPRVRNKIGMRVGTRKNVGNSRAKDCKQNYPLPLSRAWDVAGTYTQVENQQLASNARVNALCPGHRCLVPGISFLFLLRGIGGSVDLQPR
jgi:hypothetical protein